MTFGGSLWRGGSFRYPSLYEANENEYTTSVEFEPVISAFSTVTTHMFSCDY
jgi:hypothetical protein